MIQGQRLAVILQALQQHGVVTVAEICAACACSPETARRDLRRLEDQGKLVRTHGGATVLDGPSLGQKALNGTGHLEERIALTDRVDALIVTPSEPKATGLLVDRCRLAGKPVVAEAVGFRGVTTVISVDNYQAGLEAGRWAAQYARRQFGGRVVALDVSYPQPNTEARSRGFAEGLRQLGPDQPTILHVDGKGLRSTARRITADVLAVHPETNILFGVNDDSAMGALDAYRAAGHDLSRLLVVTFGLEGAATKNLMEQSAPWVVGVAMFPEVVGRACVDAAVCAYHGSILPERIISPFAIVTPDTLFQYYEKDERGDAWMVRASQIEHLSSTSPSLTLIRTCDHRRRPRRIGYVENFSSHEWYKNVREAMQERCRELGILFEVVDASHDAPQEIDTLKRAIGAAAARQVKEGDTIILDAGATAAYTARALRGRHGITVITNSLRVLAELEHESGITLVSSGGVVRAETQSLVGHNAEATFRDVRVDKTFLSATGLSLSFGLSNTNIQEATVKQAMLAAAREVILLADSSKIGTESLVKVASLEEIDRIITDAGLSAQDRLALAQRGIDVLIAADGASSQEMPVAPAEAGRR